MGMDVLKSNDPSGFVLVLGVEWYSLTNCESADAIVRPVRLPSLYSDAVPDEMTTVSAHAGEGTHKKSAQAVAQATKRDIRRPSGLIHASTVPATRSIAYE